MVTVNTIKYQGTIEYNKLLKLIIQTNTTKSFNKAAKQIMIQNY